MTALTPSALDTDVLCEAVRAFSRVALNARAIDAGGQIGDEVFEQLNELGVWGLTLPLFAGGLGGSLADATHVVRALAEADRSVATTVGLHLGLGTRALVRFGDRRLQQELLPDLASGQCIAAFATTEPQSGSDVSKLNTRLTVRGNHLVLNGEKAYVTNGGFAGLLTVTARCDGDESLERGCAMVALRADSAGLTRGHEEVKLGLRGSSTTGFFFDEVKVPRSQLLGTPSTGRSQLEHTLSWGRTLLSAGCLGTATDALERARRHTNLRHQFGRPLDQQPVVRAHLASNTVMVSAMAALVAHTAHQRDDGDLHRWSVSAKWFCSEQAFNVVDTAVQLHGAGGFLEHTGLPLMLRDVRVTRIFEGANDVLLTHAGSLELQKPLVVNDVPTEARHVVELVSRHIQHARKNLGARVFVRPDLLHQLGRAVVWRDAVLATCWAPTSAATQRIIAREAAAALHVAVRRAHPPDDLEAVMRPQ